MGSRKHCIICKKRRIVSVEGLCSECEDVVVLEAVAGVFIMGLLMIQNDRIQRLGAFLDECVDALQGKETDDNK